MDEQRHTLLREVSLSLLAAGAMLSGLSCGGGGDITEPTTGSLQITSSTSGPTPDDDGYTITIDGRDRGALATSGDVSIDELAPGEHVVGLSGVAGNCGVEGDNPRTVTVRAGESAAVGFAVTCATPAPTVGTLRITTVTTGLDSDPNGYTFALDGGPSQAIGINATAIVTKVAAGAHSIELSGIAGTCRVGETNPRSVTVSGGTTADVSFAVTCTAATGSLEITTTTTGNAPDLDGYTVAVDNAAPKTIAATATLTVPAVSPGIHQVTLGGVATNCRLEGDNPRSITITPGATARLAFILDCSSPPMSKIVWEGGNFADEHFASVILVMNADGSGQIRLTQGNAGFTPRWSPDGRRIAYTHVRDDEQVEIRLINPDGSSDRRLTTGSDPQWSPDGRVSFSGEAGLYTINADGTGQTKLTDGGGFFGYRWSPDGRKILFLRASDYDASRPFEYDLNIYVMNADGSVVTQLTHTPQDAQEDRAENPVWSPDSRRIAFSQQHRDQRGDVDGDIYVISADGRDETNLTKTPGEAQKDGYPVWSPDGSKLAFVSGHALRVMDPDGTNQINLSNSLFVDDDSGPTWSPDGTKIAFSGGDDDIWVVNADGTEPTRLTLGGFDDFNPQWSP